MDQEGVPEKLDEIVQDLGIYVPSDIKVRLEAGEKSAELELFERALSGNCMTCGAACGDHTMAVIGKPVGLDEPVVVMLYCGGACMSDMQVMGWIQQRHEDMVDQIVFRGGHGGN